MDKVEGIPEAKEQEELKIPTMEEVLEAKDAIEEATKDTKRVWEIAGVTYEMPTEFVVAQYNEVTENLPENILSVIQDGEITDAIRLCTARDIMHRLVASTLIEGGKTFRTSDRKAVRENVLYEFNLNDCIEVITSFLALHGTLLALSSFGF